MFDHERLLHIAYMNAYCIYKRLLHIAYMNAYCIYERLLKGAEKPFGCWCITNLSH